MTPFVKCNATSEGEPGPTSDMVERAAMTDDLRSFNIYTRHHPHPPPPPPPHPLPNLEITEVPRYRRPIRLCLRNKILRSAKR